MDKKTADNTTPEPTDQIAGLRQEYQLNNLQESDCPNTPIELFARWFSAACRANVREPNGMGLSTVDQYGKPRSRVVLMKDFSVNGFVFFSNYLSHKGEELDRSPHAALLFWWGQLERQVRIEGSVHKIEEYESDRYFATRPRLAQVAAAASPQSKVVADREALEELFHNTNTQHEGKELHRPANWGGYRVVPHYFEFWQGRDNRLHDRIAYRRLESDHTKWEVERLAP